MATLQVSQIPFASSSSSPSSSTPCPVTLSPRKSMALTAKFNSFSTLSLHQRRRRRATGVVGVEKEETEVRTDASSTTTQQEGADPEDLEYVRQIQRVLGLLRKNRDMLFSEIKLTVMIEDPREVERRRMLGIEDPDAPTREDLVEALEQVNEGKVPENRVALRILAEEMINWPNLEVEAPKQKRAPSLYAKATDTGVDPKEAAKRLNIDWDSAAEFEDAEVNDETEVPSAVGYGALYLVTAFPVIIEKGCESKKGRTNDGEHIVKNNVLGKV
ncbi:hypothetical protein SLE2022_163700 [Rubroshorea leprosula]